MGGAPVKEIPTSLPRTLDRSTRLKMRVAFDAGDDRRPPPRKPRGGARKIGEESSLQQDGSTAGAAEAQMQPLCRPTKRQARVTRAKQSHAAVTKDHIADSTASYTECSDSTFRQSAGSIIASAPSDETGKGGRYLHAGLFATGTNDKIDLGAFPLPLHHGLDMLESRKAFQLPEEIQELFTRQRRSTVGRMALRTKKKGMGAVGSVVARKATGTSRSRVVRQRRASATVLQRATAPRLFNLLVEAEDPALTEHVYSKKTFWDCGVYGTVAQSRPGSKVSMPLPIHTSTQMLEPGAPGTEDGFKLSWDVWYAAQHGLLTGHRDPPPYIKLRSNVYEEGTRRPNVEQSVCDCVKPKQGASGCTEDSCFNRMMFYECSPKRCPCGKQCQNQRFRRHEFVRELEVFGTMDRGFGLRSKTRILPGQLITEYCGEVITQSTCLERMSTLYRDSTNFYFLECGNGRVIDAGIRGTEAR
ncbi:hypothetical protein THASP1DRAFT_33679, partial [Thamnocephalis sphaerospora]